MMGPVFFYQALVGLFVFGCCFFVVFTLHIFSLYSTCYCCCSLLLLLLLLLLLFLVDPRIWHSEYPRQGLEGLLKTGRNSDLSFLVEGKVLRAHRIIVASQCDYFDRFVAAKRKGEILEIMYIRFFWL